MTKGHKGNPYPTQPAVMKGELPDPFASVEPGDRVATEADWRKRAERWRSEIIHTEYGGMPPASGSVVGEVLSQGAVRRLPGEPLHNTYRIHCHGGARPFSFCARILAPRSAEPVPVIINGDACWWYITDDIVRRILESGCALMLFNRTEMAEDLGYEGVTETRKRSGGIYELYPDHSFGALSAWAWGYHRCVDFLTTLPFIDSDRIAVSGHSRGGKTTILAGATDDRIALVNDNASCAGGSAAFRYVGADGETIGIVDKFPSWFGPGMSDYVGAEDRLPFDQHCLLACIAPRPVLLTYALDDRWSNPEGMVQCAWAAAEVYDFLGAKERLAFHLRSGGHAHTEADWEVLLDFIAWNWMGKPPQAAYNQHPYRHLRPAFSWKAPTR